MCRHRVNNKLILRLINPLPFVLPQRIQAFFINNHIVRISKTAGNKLAEELADFQIGRGYHRGNAFGFEVIGRGVEVVLSTAGNVPGQAHKVQNIVYHHLFLFIRCHHKFSPRSRCRHYTSGTAERRFQAVSFSDRTAASGSGLPHCGTICR